MHLTGNNVDSNTQRRIAGVQKAIDETGGKVKLLQTITDVDTDLADRPEGRVRPARRERLRDQRDRDHGVQPRRRRSAEAIKESGLPIKVVAIDDDATVLAGIKDGSISAPSRRTRRVRPYVGSCALTKLRERRVHDEGRPV